MKSAEKRKILLIEDNPGDIKLLEEAISYNDLNVELMVLEDGESSLEYYENLKKNDYTDLPDLIISDLNIPKINGKEVIKVFKSDPSFKHIPIIVLTTSNLESDIQECYSYCANAFLVKPIDINQFFDLIKLIDTFWLRNCELISGK